MPVHLKFFTSLALAIVLGAFAFRQLWWRDRIECLGNLTSIDHAINCPGVVMHEHLKVGDPISSLSFADFGGMAQCPTGRTYILPKLIGEHPTCPVHGNLITIAGVQHHTQQSRNQLELFKENAVQVLYFAGLCAPLLLLFPYAPYVWHRFRKLPNA